MTCPNTLRGSFCRNNDEASFDKDKKGRYEIVKEYEDGFLIRELKIVRISKEDFSVDVVSFADNIVAEDCLELKLKEGDSLRKFYYNNKDYKFERKDYYEKPYTQEDKYEILNKQNPFIEQLKKNGDCDFT